MKLPYESQPIPDPTDNIHTLLRTVYKGIVAITFLMLTIHFLLPLRESFVKSQNEPTISLPCYENPGNKSPHTKGINHAKD